MLTSIRITKLFGRFDYTLKFSDAGIMIITGPNGYGKSTILRMINDFCNNGMEKVLTYSFKTFVLTCDKDEIIIKKNANVFKINDHAFPYPNEKWERRRGLPPYIRRIGYDEYIDIRTDEKVRIISPIEKNNIFEGVSWDDRFFFAVADAIEINSRNSSKTKEELFKLKDAISKIVSIKKCIGTVSFIQEQRLIEKREIQDDERSYNRSKTEYITVINENSEKLKSVLAEIMKEHSSLSSELDSTYIKRLFNAENVLEYDYDEMRHNLQELQDKQEKLNKYGLAEIKNVSYIYSIERGKFDKFKTELSIYLEDANAKYEVFEKVIDKLDLYERIVNQKLTFKKMHLSRTGGIIIESDEGAKISLNDLSSGEQEILVLFYKLIFESDVNLLLIDEPEISLHIAWQKEIMENLKSIVNLNKGIQVMIATHSPQIISHNWDLQIDLGGLHNG